MNKLIQTLIFVFILAWSVCSQAAITATLSSDGKTVTLTGVDEGTAADWTWTDTFTNARYADGIRVNYIRFHPGATDDLCSIEDADTSTVKHFLVKCADTYDDRIQYYFGAKLKLAIDANDTDGTWSAVYSAGNSITIQLWSDN